MHRGFQVNVYGTLRIDCTQELQPLLRLLRWIPVVPVRSSSTSDIRSAWGEENDLLPAARSVLFIFQLPEFRIDTRGSY